DRRGVVGDVVVSREQLPAIRSGTDNKAGKIRRGAGKWTTKEERPRGADIVRHYPTHYRNRTGLPKGCELDDLAVVETILCGKAAAALKLTGCGRRVIDGATRRRRIDLREGADEDAGAVAHRPVGMRSAGLVF